jgi:predicted metalloenzyme YecM
VEKKQKKRLHCSYNEGGNVISERIMRTRIMIVLVLVLVLEMAVSQRSGLCCIV